MDTRSAGAGRRASATRRKPKAFRYSSKSAAERSKELRAILRDIDAGLRRRGITPAERRQLLKWINDG